jgi:hypothetical protein
LTGLSFLVLLIFTTSEGGGSIIFFGKSEQPGSIIFFGKSQQTRKQNYLWKI